MDRRFPSRARRSRIEAPPLLSIMRPLLLSKVGIPMERAPSTTAGAIGFGSGADCTNTGPPVPRRWGSGAPCQSSMRLYVDLEYGIVVPRRIVDLRCEEVPIVLVPTCPSHHVDAGPATQDFPHIH